MQVIRKTILSRFFFAFNTYIASQFTLSFQCIFILKGRFLLVGLKLLKTYCFHWCHLPDYPLGISKIAF